MRCANSRDQTERTSKMKSLTRFGTYGFLSALLAAQMAMAPSLRADDAKTKVDRARVDARKSARAVKRDVKKGARKATGQDNTYDDVKDEVKDAGKNVKDEVEHQAEKLD